MCLFLGNQDEGLKGEEHRGCTACQYVCEQMKEIVSKNRPQATIEFNGQAVRIGSGITRIPRKASSSSSNESGALKTDWSTLLRDSKDVKEGITEIA